MTERADLRRTLGFTQPAAASRAGVSLATWRRWEADPDSVSTATAEACERVLHGPAPHQADGDFERRWEDRGRITPRQAFAFAVVLGTWADELTMWGRSPQSEPLHQVGPFVYFDKRVMFPVGENIAFALAVRDRCAAVTEELEQGVLPFDREGRFIDEVLIGAAQQPARAHLEDMPELFDDIAPRLGNEGGEIADDDWDLLSDWFDDEAYSADWEVPLGLPSLPLLLDSRHPYTWFDLGLEPPSYSQWCTATGR